jgi:phosphate transport system permease protein
MATTMPDLSPRRSARTFRNGLASSAFVLSFVLVCLPLGFLLVTVVTKGAGILSWSFLTKNIPSVRRSGPGMGPAVVGTLLMTGLASLMAIPLGVMGAVYLHEYGKTGRVAAVLRFLANVMTGVPSIVMGLFIFTIWVLPRKGAGFSGFAGSMALGCLMLPVVIRSTEEMLRLVPDHLREASLALGTSKARTIVTVVLPAALPGISSGVLLAVARAAGETAPLLFTVGVVSKANTNLFRGPNTALSAQIFSNASVGLPGATARAWGAALTLVIIAFLVTFVARVVVARFDPLRKAS